MQSLEVFRKCARLLTQFNKQLIQVTTQQPLSTCATSLGKSEFSRPTRTVMTEIEETKEKIELKKFLSGQSEAAAAAASDNKQAADVYFENRNPRHLELLGYDKPAGFPTLHENRSFWNKLHLHLTNRHVKAFVENINGQIVCYASTTEFAIAKRLHSTNDVMAVVNIARVLAVRLKKSGLDKVTWMYKDDRTTEKIREFEGVLMNSGIRLTEAPFKVLEGRPETMPPPRPIRVLPRRCGDSGKRQGTWARKDKVQKIRF